MTMTAVGFESFKSLPTPVQYTKYKTRYFAYLFICLFTYLFIFVFVFVLCFLQGYCD